MYTDMYDTFDNNCIPYDYPYSFRKDFKDYLEGCKATYEIDYQDTAVIPFKISDKYVYNYINIIVYNFRREEIYCETTTVDYNGVVYLNITDEISSKLFKRGMYYIQIQAETLVNGVVSVSTLIPAEECTLHVR